MIAEIEYWKSVVGGLVAPKVRVLPYVPRTRKLPSRVLSSPTAWKGIESVLSDLILRFNIGDRRCLEFGVEYGYSTVALSSFFDTVTGVDIFCGDKHTDNKNDIFTQLQHGSRVLITSAWSAAITVTGLPKTTAHTT